MTRLLGEQQAARAEKFDLNPERVELLLQRAGREVEAGLLPAAQIAIARQGEVVFQHNFGTAQGQFVDLHFFRHQGHHVSGGLAAVSKRRPCRRRGGCGISCRSLVPTKKIKSP